MKLEKSSSWWTENDAKKMKSINKGDVLKAHRGRTEEVV